MSSNPAFDYVKQILDSYGLGEMGQWAWDQIVEGRSEAEVIQSMREQEPYKVRFAGLMMRQERGLPAMSEAEYVDWEAQASNIMHFYGLPVGFYDEPQDFAEMIGNNVSTRELESRVQIARQATELAPSYVKDTLAAEYGISVGDLTAFYLDPDRATDVLERQITAAEISGGWQDRDLPYEGPSFEESEQLVRDSGLSAEDARSSLGEIEARRQLFQQQAGGRQQFGTREDMFGALKGEAESIRRIERVGRQRVAEHRGEATGGFGRTESGGFAVGTAR